MATRIKDPFDGITIIRYFADKFSEKISKIVRENAHYNPLLENFFEKRCDCFAVWQQNSCTCIINIFRKLPCHSGQKLQRSQIVKHIKNQFGKCFVVLIKVLQPESFDLIDNRIKSYLPFPSNVRVFILSRNNFDDDTNVIKSKRSIRYLDVN